MLYYFVWQWCRMLNWDWIGPLRPTPSLSLSLCVCWNLISRKRWKQKLLNRVNRISYLPNTTALWKMDQGKIRVRQLVDIVVSIVVQCFGGDRIFDNCRDRLHNHASFVLFRVAVETIEPRRETWEIVHKTLYSLVGWSDTSFGVDVVWYGVSL